MSLDYLHLEILECSSLNFWYGLSQYSFISQFEFIYPHSYQKVVSRFIILKYYFRSQIIIFLIILKVKTTREAK